MSRPSLFLQIADENGVVVHLNAGGPLELDLIQHFKTAILLALSKAGVSHTNQIDTLTKSIMQRNVGFFKTQAKVEAAVREGLADVTNTIDSSTSIDKAIQDALTSAVKALKDQTIHTV